MAKGWKDVNDEMAGIKQKGCPFISQQLFFNPLSSTKSSLRLLVVSTMCYNDNSAEHAIDYFNSQYETLWIAAKKCYEKYEEKDRKPEGFEQRYQLSLYKYYHGQQRPQGPLHDLSFYATFDKPSLDFVCNHEALLTLSIVKGHYHAEINKGLFTNAGKRARNESLDGIKATFRIPFSISYLRGGISKIGNGDHLIKLLTLDFSKAQLSQLSRAIAEPAKTTLTDYLLGYLELLQKAGHHILFCFPDFDDSGLHHDIDFSLASRTSSDATVIYGIEIEKINSHLSTSWARAVMLAVTAAEDIGASFDRAGVSLAEYKSTWSGQHFDVHFHLLFGKPKIEALCSQEVVIYFTLDEVHFYDDKHFTESSEFGTFSEWKFAFLFNVVHEKLEDGKATRCTLDLLSGQFMEHHSDLRGYDARTCSHDFLSHLLDFFTFEYFSLLESADYHIIYHFDLRWPQLVFDFGGNSFVLDDPEDAEGEDCRDKPVIWREIVKESHTCGYDVVTSVTQASINSLYRTIWQSISSHEGHSTRNILRNWTYQDIVEARFQRITVRLLSHYTAIIWIHLENGSLKAPNQPRETSDSDDKYTLSNWRLAFEVPLRMTDHKALPGTASDWINRFSATQVFKEYGNIEECTFQHVYLDLTAAEFVSELSNFTEVDLNRQSISRVHSLICHIKKDYFQQLMSAGYHVLHTTPVWRGPDSPRYAVTNLKLHLHSEVEVTRQTVKSHVHGTEPVIVLLGMIQNRPAPITKVDFPAHWIARASRLSRTGIICVSRDVFLHRRVLSLLDKVNAATTLIPEFTGVRGDKWGLKLTTWAENVHRKQQPTPFTVEESHHAKDGLLQYQWKHHERWIHELLRAQQRTKQTYTVSCLTDNRLEFPTAYRHGIMEVKVSGCITLSIGFSDTKVVPDQSSWTAEASASWSVVLAVQSQAGGLTVSSPIRQPEYKTQGFHASDMLSFRIDPEELLRQYFRETPDLHGLIHEFKGFEGTWKYSYPGNGAFNLAHPAFNRNGDLLFELRTFAAQGTAFPLSPRQGMHNRGRQNVYGRHGHSHPKARAEDVIVLHTEDFHDTPTRAHQGIAYTRTYSQNGSTTLGSEERNSTDRSPNLTAHTSGQEMFESHFFSGSRATTPNITASRTYAAIVSEPKTPQPHPAHTPPSRPSSAAGSQLEYNSPTPRVWTTTYLSPDDRRTPGHREMHNGSPLSVASNGHVQLDDAKLDESGLLGGTQLVAGEVTD